MASYSIGSKLRRSGLLESSFENFCCEVDQQCGIVAVERHVRSLEDFMDNLRICWNADGLT